MLVRVQPSGPFLKYWIKKYLIRCNWKYTQVNMTWIDLIFENRVDKQLNKIIYSNSLGDIYKHSSLVEH